MAGIGAWTRDITETPPGTGGGAGHSRELEALGHGIEQPRQAKAQHLLAVAASARLPGAELQAVLADGWVSRHVGSPTIGRQERVATPRS
jgi:hypothetical protein